MMNKTKFDLVSFGFSFVAAIRNMTEEEFENFVKGMRRFREM